MADIRTPRAERLQKKLWHAEQCKMERDYPWITASCMVEVVELLGRILKELESANNKLEKIDCNTRRRVY